MNKRKIPKFTNESEEAKWWFDNRKDLDLDFSEAAKQGKLKRVTVSALQKRLTSPSRVVSIRIPESDIATARRQAAAAGLPYQTYLKSLLHQALERNEKMRAS